MGLQEELKSAYEGMRAAVQAKQGEVERSVRALEAELERKVVRLKAETEHTVKAMRAAMLESEEEMVHGVERVRVDIEAKIEAVKARAVQGRRETVPRSVDKYSEGQVAAACEGFHPRHLIGQGGCGAVYRGLLHHSPVAIKKVKEGGREALEREVRAAGLTRWGGDVRC